MPADTQNSPPSDPFTAFWSEMTQRMFTPERAPSPSEEAMNHMRKFFFEMMAQQADQYMRSDEFCQFLKQATDNSLAWQKQLNDSLQQGLAAAQMPSRADSDHLVTLIRGMEERLLKKLDTLNERVSELETARQGD
jgi:hypothetical protein